MRIKRAYKIPDQITMGIFRLPCVMSVRKEGEDSFVYSLKPFEDGMDTYFVIDHDYDQATQAHPGQWLCELQCGDWVVLDDDEYKKVSEETLNKMLRGETSEDDVDRLRSIIPDNWKELSIEER